MAPKKKPAPIPRKKATKKKMTREDVNQAAARIVREATRETED